MVQHSAERINRLAAQVAAGAGTERCKGLVLQLAPTFQPSVVANLNFFDYDAWDKKTKPAQFNMDLTSFPSELQEQAAKQESAGRLVTLKTPIYNGRLVVNQLSLDATGFRFVDAPTMMTGEDFYHIDRVHKIYFKECIELVKRMTGATAVLPFDHSVRNAKLASTETGISNPVRFIHNDNTIWSGPKRARELLKDTCPVEEILQYRFAVMNVWRRWDGGNDAPLAVCSGDSLAPDLSDMVGTDLVYRNRTGEIYSAVSTPNQAFFWFPDMRASEAILLKVYDSHFTGETSILRGQAPPVAGWTLHSGFDHPNHSYKDGTERVPRESCEVRVLVLWAPEDLARRAELKGVTGLFGGDRFYDAELGEYVDNKDGASAVMRSGNQGSHDYSAFQLSK